MGRGGMGGEPLAASSLAPSGGMTVCRLDPAVSWLCGVATLAAGGLLLNLAWSCWRWGITPTPSVGPARRACLHLIAQNSLPAGGRVVDLGCGLGGMARAIARLSPGIHVWAIEGSMLLYGLCRLLFRRCGVCWQRADFQQCDLRGCSGVFCYLYPGAMRPLATKLRRELAPGAWIVSHAFALPGWVAERIVVADDWRRTPVYLYRVPGG